MSASEYVIDVKSAGAFTVINGICPCVFCDGINNVKIIM